MLSPEYGHVSSEWQAINSVSDLDKEKQFID